MSHPLRTELKDIVLKVVIDNGNEHPDELSTKIERICYNMSIEIATAGSIKLSWNNPEFIKIYESQREKIIEIVNDSTIIDTINLDNVSQKIRINLMALNDLTNNQGSIDTPRDCNAASSNVSSPSINKNDHSTRAAFKAEVLKIFADNGLDAMHEFVDQLERSCYNLALIKTQEEDVVPSWGNDTFVNKYHYLTYNIVVNLDPQSTVGSSHLLNMIKDKKISAGEIARVPIHELAPKHSEDIRKYIIEQAKQKIEEKTSSLFYCKKCGERKTTYREAQTRSSDEPTTIFVTCVNCKNRWIC